ncbi:MAG: hypothetical protein LBS10_04255 [Gracilibacteraceae bacterium]|jgi:hypothetical protein|nr:hypothetical protein [Gracilibacteraceae bacterium]
MKWDDAKKIILQNEEVRKELKNNEAEYKIIEEIINSPVLWDTACGKGAMDIEAVGGKGS